MTVDVYTAADEQDLCDFLTANRFADLASAVAEVSDRLLRPEQAVAERGPASPLVGGLVRDVMDAGGPDAVDVAAVVKNGLTCRAIFAAWPRDERDAFFHWIETAPREDVAAFWGRVKARYEAEEGPAARSSATAGRPR